MFSNRSRGGESVAFIFLVDKKKGKEKEKTVHIPAGKKTRLPGTQISFLFLNHEFLYE